ncbi:MAG TPA: ABC transporter ATP-binding protein [Vicinamibacterales bacterium]|nr:ABC transporter ATP-binding protein [Vicinamibacterales bacterium]
MSVHLTRTLLSLCREMRRAAAVDSLVCLGLSVALALTEGAGLLMLMPLLELVGVIEGSPVPSVSAWIAFPLAAVGLVPTLGTVLLLFVGTATTRSLVQRWQTRLQGRVREEVGAALRVRLYQAIAEAEWRFLVSRPAYHFVHALTSEVGVIGGAAGRTFELLTGLLVGATYLAVAVRVAPLPAALVVACAAVLAVVARESLLRARESADVAAHTRRRLNTILAEHVASLKSAKTTGATGLHTTLIRDLSLSLRHAALSVAGTETDLLHRIELGTVVLLAIIVYVSVTVLAVPAALLLLLLYIFARLMPRVISVYRQLQGLAAAAPAVESVARLERDCVGAAEHAGAAPLPLSPLRTDVRFESVSFAYLERPPVLDCVNIAIAAGCTTALVGVSGSGKSTVADLATGLLLPSAGRILVDGVELTPARLSSWRAQVGYVAQDTFFFDDSVRMNLSFGQHVPEAEFWRALQLAAADQFVADLPDGLDTHIGDRGLRLSGGERQRLAIARALLRQPRLLVLDEATSALDAENAAHIERSILQLHHRVTILIISHRLELVRHADLVHVIDAGRVVQSGRWHELRADAGGRFAALLRSDSPGGRGA